MYEPKKVKVNTRKTCNTLPEVEQWLKTLHTLTSESSVTIDTIRNEANEYFATLFVFEKEYKKFFKRFVEDFCGFDNVEQIEETI